MSVSAKPIKVWAYGPAWRSDGDLTCRLQPDHVAHRKLLCRGTYKYLGVLRMLISEKDNALSLADRLRMVCSGQKIVDP
ncbi:hypothetical protein BM1_10137 [Bipolaris maydis]|nr:hypothetical protein BM1_10137 [Bipolaris maydis]